MSDTDQIQAQMTMAFASPIVHFKVPKADALNAMLVSEAHAMRTESEGVDRSNRRGWHSETDLMHRQEPGISNLVKIIENTIRSATKSIAPRFDPSEYNLTANGWININPTHGYNVPHKHSGFMWSGCYYVSVPKDEVDPARSSGSIEFLSPLLVPGNLAALKATCYKDRIRVLPNAGDLLLFPSYLMHWVYPNESAEDRITIAFNASYLPK